MQKPTLIKLKAFVAAFFLLTSTYAQQSAIPKREFRAVWIASVANIDWPSQKSLSSVTQMEEFRFILNEQQKNGMNAVIVQVRPTADALYSSKLELWSTWLTGKQGQEPNPPYDPLAFQIEEAHQRNMEFHAWFNPYRATFDTIAINISPQHITRTKPEWFIKYGDKLYFNPALPEVRSYITSVIMDVVRRYDVDGVHFDDYFYPYAIPNTPFPDDKDFALYANGFTNKDDWRRNNVDQLIKMVSDSLQATKPYVKFGISPFGVWKNKSANDPDGSDTKAGAPTYYALYADVKGWLQKGWIDYVVPQVYWHIGHPAADYQKIVDWWSKNNFGRHLYVGQGTYKAGKDATYPQWSDPKETGRQIRINRSYPQIQGSVYFSSKSVMANPVGMQDSLREHFYRYPALIPTMPWKDSIAPMTPTEVKVISNKEQIQLAWHSSEAASDGDHARYYIIYRVLKGETIQPQNVHHILAIHRGKTSYTDTTAQAGIRYRYAVSAVDRLHNESEFSNEVGAKRK